MSTRAGRASDAIDRGERSPAEARLLLGRLLRRHRRRRAISVVGAAQAVGMADATLTGLEYGQLRSIRLKDVLRLCDLYGVCDHDERVGLLGLAGEGNAPDWWAGFGDVFPAWWETYLALEQTSSRIRSFDQQFVPGLLQTPEYARAVLAGESRDEGEVEHRVALRMLRQRRLTAEATPQVWAIIDETALRRPAAERPVMFRQLQHLADLCDLPRLRIQILPLSRPAPFTGGPIALLSPSDGLGEVVYLEQLTTALYIDEPDDVLHYRHVLNCLATSAPEPHKSPEILRNLMREM